MVVISQRCGEYIDPNLTNKISELDDDDLAQFEIQSIASLLKKTHHAFVTNLRSRQAHLERSPPRAGTPRSRRRHLRPSRDGNKVPLAKSIDDCNTREYDRDTCPSEARLPISIPAC